MKKHIVVFDVETTGLDKTKDQVIQISMLKVDSTTYEIVDSFDSYVQPQGNYTISLGAYFKHGIKPEFLSDKPYFIDIAERVMQFFETPETVSVLGYNSISFDQQVLVAEFARCGIEFSFMPYECYDAFLEEKRRNGINLENTYKRYKGKTMEEAGLEAHNAMSDIKATLSVFVAQQRNQEYGPEKMVCEDGFITEQEFDNGIRACFTMGKYRGVPIEMVANIDQGYLIWLRDKSNVSKTTKEFVNQYIK